MPDAAGAVEAAAIADRMLGPKERRQLAIILVGLPARGKTFTAAKLVSGRYVLRSRRFASAAKVV